MKDRDVRNVYDRDCKDKNNRMRENFSVMQNFAMIAQLGLNMTVPLVLCIFGASFLHRKFGVGNWIIIVGIILGIVILFYQFAYFFKNAMKQTKGGGKK